MIAVCQQPHYLPWLGYFELFSRADAFVFLDSVQWVRQGRQHRTKILLNGRPEWLTIPIHGHGHREKTLKDMEVAGSGWAAEHWRLIKQAYGKAPQFHSQVEPLMRPFFEKAAKEKFLVDVSLQSLWLFWEPLQLECALHWSSDMPGPEERQDRLISLCRRLGADEYYSSLGSTRYIDLSRFRAAGLRVSWQHFRAGFPGELTRPADLSALDWLAHHDWKVLKAAIAPRSGFPAELLAPREYKEGPSA